MAKQTGPNPFIGRKGDLLGYRMGGGYYVRIVSSLSAERVKRDPAFKRTMQCAGLLAQASRVASAAYRLLGVKEHGLYRRLTGMAMQLLKQGKTAEEALRQLGDDSRSLQPPAEVSRQQERICPAGSQQPVQELSFSDELLERLFPESVPVPEGEEIPVANQLSSVNRHPSTIISSHRSSQSHPITFPFFHSRLSS